MIRFGIVASLVALFLWVADARAAVVVNTSIAGIRIGDSETRVRSVLGAPSRRVVRDGRARHVYTRRRVVVVLAGKAGEVVAVETTSGRERTRDGLGVGTSRATLRARLDGETCSGGRRRGTCSVQTPRRRTSFRYARGRVFKVVLAERP